MMARIDVVVPVEAHARNCNAKVAADHGFKLRQVIALDKLLLSGLGVTEALIVRILIVVDRVTFGMHPTVQLRSLFSEM